MKTSELIRIITRYGTCRLLRSGSKHDIWINTTTGRRFLVPRHPSKEIPTGTARKIMKDAGVKEDEL